MLFLNFEGEIIKKIPLKSGAWLVYPLENGNYFIIETRYAPSGEYSDNLMMLYNSDMDEIKQLISHREPNIRVAQRLKGTMIERAFILWAISKGKIYVGDNDQRDYEILVYDYDGNLVKKIRKEYSPVEISDEFKKKILSTYERSPNIIVRDLTKKIYFPRYRPPYQSVFCDDVGRLFVMTHEKGANAGEYIYDIFDPEGRFISRVGLGNYGSWERIVQGQLVVIAKKNRIYCTGQKESGYKELVVYKMSWE